MTETYYCSRCVTQQPFVGALDGDAFSSWGLPTLGLALLLKEIARFTVARPVCIECGSAVVRAAQKYFWEGAEVAARESGDESERTTAAPRRGRVEIRPVPDVSSLALVFGAVDATPPRRSKKRLEWSGNAGTLVRILDENGELLAKVPTDFTYYGGAYLVAEDRALILFQPGISTSYEKVSVFRQTGHCAIPWGKQKWGRIICIDSKSGFGTSTHQEEFSADRSVFFSGSEGFGVIDAKALTRSYYRKRDEREFYNRIGLSRDKRRVIMATSKYDDDDRGAMSIEVSQVKDGKLVYAIPVDGEQTPPFADNGDVLAIAAPGAILLYDLDTGVPLGATERAASVYDLLFAQNDPRFFRAGGIVYQVA
jgi:hypothetical protein